MLACDLVAQNGWRQLEDSDPRVVQLSTLLQGLPLHPPSARLPNFRNPNGVGRKTADIATAHPGYRGVRTHGGRTDRDVIAEFLADPAGMHELAQTLRNDAIRGDFRDLTNPVDDEDFAAQEGRLLIRRHVTRERSRSLRQRKIQSVRHRGQPLACEACGFDFEQTYGDRGRGYIECHHVLPLYLSRAGTTRLQDLALLCANCHRIIHARSPWITPTQLSGLIQQRSRHVPHIE